MNVLKIVFVMMIWGSIAVLTRNISLPALLLASLRAIIALPVVYIFIRKQKLNLSKELFLKQNYIIYITGALLGIAWMFLFKAYENTSVALATLTYNMCPIYVVLLSRFFLKEKIFKRQYICISLAFLGISIILSKSFYVDSKDLSGIIYGLLSGLLYATIVLLNKKFTKQISSEVSTFIQLMMAFIVLLPMVLFSNPVPKLLALTTIEIILIFLLGIVHTGVAYYLYFSSYKKLDVSNIALLSYLEPVFAIIFSVILLHESLGIYEIVGCILIIGSAFGEDIYRFFKFRNTVQF